MQSYVCIWSNFDGCSKQKITLNVLLKKLLNKKLLVRFDKVLTRDGNNAVSFLFFC
jgi:hypothetical protein